MIATVVVAALAFVVDRLFLGRPAEAVAEPVSPATSKTKTVPAAKGLGLTDPSLERLAGLSDAPVTRDVFRPSETMLARFRAIEEQQQEQAAAAATGPVPGSAEAFQAEHELQATVTSAGASLAIVDGTVVRVGQRVADYELIRIDARSAEFRRGHQRVILSLRGPTTSPP